MKLTDKIDVIKYSGGEYKAVPDQAVHEFSLSVFVQGNYKTTLYCSPENLRELVTGYLYTEGIIYNVRAIDSVFINEVSAGADVLLKRGTYTDVEYTKRNEDSAEKEAQFDKDILLANLSEFYTESKLFEDTGGVHKCALCSNDGILVSHIDVSRHNAVDKVIGAALIEGIALSDKYIITSGRVPQDMVKKAVRAGVRMLVSRAAPTIEAVQSARENKLTLLGFAKGDRFNIYCGDAMGTTD